MCDVAWTVLFLVAEYDGETDGWQMDKWTISISGWPIRSVVLKKKKKPSKYSVLLLRKDETYLSHQYMCKLPHATLESITSKGRSGTVSHPIGNPLERAGNLNSQRLFLNHGEKVLQYLFEYISYVDS